MLNVEHTIPTSDRVAKKLTIKNFIAFTVDYSSIIQAPINNREDRGPDTHQRQPGIHAAPGARASEAGAPPGPGAGRLPRHQLQRLHAAALPEPRAGRPPAPRRPGRAAGPDRLRRHPQPAAAGKIGLVERQQDPRDARVAYAALTGAGREMVGNAVTVAEQISKDCCAAARPRCSTT
jgi:hypothetical protein